MTIVLIACTVAAFVAGRQWHQWNGHSGENHRHDPAVLDSMISKI